MEKQAKWGRFHVLKELREIIKNRMNLEAVIKLKSFEKLYDNNMYLVYIIWDYMG